LNETLYLRLYDHRNGGGARAFQCQVCPHCNQVGQANYHKHEFTTCNRVTRTERGMWAHLWFSHGIKRQKELWEETDDCERGVS